MAAPRSVSGLDRVMDNLGLAHGQQTTQQQNVNMFTGRARDGSMGFSPPEELPAVASRAMPPPLRGYLPHRSTPNLFSLNLRPRSYDKLIGTILFYMVNPRRSDRIILLDFKLRYNDRWMSML